MTGNPFWIRKTAVEIGPSGGTGRRWDSVRVNFSVVKTDNPQADTATIQLWNLSPDSRNFAKTGQVVRLFAGYESAPLGQIFSGEAKKVANVKDGLDFVTSIEGADGGRIIRVSRLSATYRGPIGLRSLFARVAASMGLSNVVLPDSLPDIQYQGGYTAFGPSRKVLDDLVKTAKAKWMIQDGDLVISMDKKATAHLGVILSQDTGMIGTPERLDGGRIKVVSLLNGLIKPRRPLKVASRWINGWFIPKLVTHAGDSGWSTEYYTTVEAIEASI